MFKNLFKNAETADAGMGDHSKNGETANTEEAWVWSIISPQRYQICL